MAKILFEESNVSGALRIYAIYLDEYLSSETNFNYKLVAAHEYEQASFQFRNEDKMMVIYTQISEWIKKNVSINHINYVTAKSLVGRLYARKGQYSKALEIYKFCYELNEKNNRLEY